jgi:hypothetical protein
MSGGAAAPLPLAPSSRPLTGTSDWSGRGNLLSANTLENYDALVTPFLAGTGACGVRRFSDLDIGTVRTYRGQEATRTGKHGRRLRPHTVLDSHRALLTFCAGPGRRDTSSMPGSWT